MQRPARSRREEALELADALLADIELAQMPPPEIARKTYRLARLLDDAPSTAWLQFEVSGYPSGALPREAWEAAVRSNRTYVGAKGKPLANTDSLAQLQAKVDGTMAQLAASADPPVSLQSANPNQWVSAPQGAHGLRSTLRNYIAGNRATIDKIVGAFHSYAVERHQELRFGSAMETAFEVVRADVDARFARLVPDGPQKLAAAFENAASDNPEHWANAASTCRRLLKATADALRPPGAPVDGRQMSDRHYINRLMDWIAGQAESDTSADVIKADLEYLGRRLDASDDAGHKGAHAEVDRFDASRFLTGTYLTLGDILRLATDQTPVQPVDAGAEVVDLPASPEQGEPPAAGT